MTDNGDGTYSYTYSMNIDGTITVLVYQERYVYGTLYPSYDFTGSPESRTYSSLYIDWSTGIIVGGIREYFTAYLYATLIPPYTETYNIFIDHNDDIRFYIDNSLVYQSWTTFSSSGSFNINLNANQRYDVYIEFRQDFGSAYIYVYWSSPHISQVAIPASAFTEKNGIGMSQYDVTVTCPPGYTGENPASPALCITE